MGDCTDLHADFKGSEIPRSSLSGEMAAGLSGGLGQGLGVEGLKDPMTPLGRLLEQDSQRTLQKGRGEA